jgi:hypothetical protein
MKHKMLKVSQLLDTIPRDSKEYDRNPEFFFFFNVHEYENWETLKESLKKGYAPHQHPRGFITVVKIWFTDEYLVYDGSHRVKLLKEMYGKEYQIEVKVIPRWNAIGQLFLLFLMLPFVIIKRKIKR